MQAATGKALASRIDIVRWNWILVIFIVCPSLWVENIISEPPLIKSMLSMVGIKVCMIIVEGHVKEHFKLVRAFDLAIS